MYWLLEHWLDITTTILGLAYILLEYRASAWMWLAGFLMQVLGIVLYYQKGLYADCGMEFYYIAVTIYGFYQWVRPNGNNTGEQKRTDSENGIPITHFKKKLILPWLIVTAVIWATIYWLLVTYTDSRVPLADSFTTALSIVGIWALAHKYLEQWFIWIAVDIVTCILYFYKDIPFKASLYALYVGIAVMGYLKWRKMMRKGNQAEKQQS